MFVVDPKKYRFQSEIQQMMFVFGEVSDPLPETTTLVEDIVRSQVIEILIQASVQAGRRNSRYISAEDLIFLIRHDRAKLNRLRLFLSWKDVRKNTKEGSGDSVEEVVEDTNAVVYRSIIKLPWELVNQFSDVMVKAATREDEDEDEDEVEAYNDSIQRLKEADDITRAMTRDEYVHYSECRQASFTYRKAKRFRDWANISAYMDVRPNDDIVDSLGFLTFEMVSKLTTMALHIKQDLAEAADRNKKKEDDKLNGTGVKRKRSSSHDLLDANASTSTPPATSMATPSSSKDPVADKDLGDEACGLFTLPTTDQSPLLPEHIHEAFRRLQQAPQPLKNFRGGLVRTRISLI
ncbi:TFIID-18kDa-domain-containing protein [Hesseltinella vesiculosa]|uniref:TFIID-18kDa-domain-containing protein n=1 Tax=Hesseltinella vesiculosa TaxID=101127 RepID=A0A1X2G997_9FUNG|nr:TFIID-18kDa-domain-containing protein [Hesseltinella vesiculosa]